MPHRRARHNNDTPFTVIWEVTCACAGMKIVATPLGSDPLCAYEPRAGGRQVELLV